MRIERWDKNFIAEHGKNKIAWHYKRRVVEIHILYLHDCKLQIKDNASRWFRCYHAFVLIGERTNMKSINEKWANDERSNRKHFHSNKNPIFIDPFTIKLNALVANSLQSWDSIVFSHLLSLVWKKWRERSSLFWRHW